MLMVTQLSGFGSGFSGGSRLYDVILNLGLTTGLQLCLDSGDSLSYTSGQSWLDRSGNGYDFFLGADGSATATDPTFAGAVGDQSAYWSFDGGDYFRYDSTNEAWMNRLHQNNAIFTIVSFCFPAIPNGVPATNRTLLATNGGHVSSPAIGIGVDPDGNIRVSNGPSSPANVLSASPTSKANDLAWNMTGISLDEASGAGGSFCYLNGAYNQVSGSDTFNGTYTSPSASDASYKMEICARGNALLPVGSGTRLSCLAIWDGIILTKVNMDSIWDAMRGRFGL